MLVHITHRPADVKSWSGVLELLPEILSGLFGDLVVFKGGVLRSGSCLREAGAASRLTWISPALAPASLDPERWLSTRGEWDDEQIGLLATHPPAIEDLEAELHRLYGWLADLTALEARLARADAGDRGEVIGVVKSLPDSNLTDEHIW